MSRSFRPVRTAWGTHSSVFIEGDTLIVLLDAIARSVNTEPEVRDREDFTEWYVSDGRAVLAALSDLTVVAAAAYLADITVDKGDLANVVHNMNLLAAREWQDELESDGELRLYID